MPLMKKNKGFLSATTIAQRSYCEKQMVLDKQFGKLETDIQKQRKERGDEEHLRHHLTAQKFGSPRDSRCFIATEIYGNTAPETQALRLFRDTRLMTSSIGKLATSLYYDLSPSIVRVMKKSPMLKRTVKYMIDFVVKRVNR